MKISSLPICVRARYTAIMQISKYNRIVIKIGSSIIANEGKLNFDWLKSVASDIAELGTEVIIVTSGGVALGRNAIGKSSGELKLEEKQAAVACGQIDLMQGYREAFAPRHVAQVLLTLWDTERRRNYLNAKNAIETLLNNNVIPVINENDVTATAELHYGDNDRLSARVAQMLGADLLVILSDVDGLYDANPLQNKDAKFIDEVTDITQEIEGMAGDSTSTVGSGGMKTKVEAAKIAVAAGCDCAILSGKKDNPLTNIDKSTIFKSKTNPLTARKTWIVSGVNPMGEITIDAGAEKALKDGSSLLPAGATEVSGQFERGDLVVIKGENGEIARGLTAYSSENAAKIIGKQSSEIEQILGYSGRAELVHRDDMVLTVEKP